MSGVKSTPNKVESNKVESTDEHRFFERMMGLDKSNEEDLLGMIKSMRKMYAIKDFMRQFEDKDGSCFISSIECKIELITPIHEDKTLLIMNDNVVDDNGFDSIEAAFDAAKKKLLGDLKERNARSIGMFNKPLKSLNEEEINKLRYAMQNDD